MSHIIFGTYIYQKIIVYPKFKFNWVPYIFSGNPAPREPEMWGYVTKN